jgi:hypothetical protein
VLKEEGLGFVGGLLPPLGGSEPLPLTCLAR